MPFATPDDHPSAYAPGMAAALAPDSYNSGNGRVLTPRYDQQFTSAAAAAPSQQAAVATPSRASAGSTRPEVHSGRMFGLNIGVLDRFSVKRKPASPEQESNATAADMSHFTPSAARRSVQTGMFHGPVTGKAAEPASFLSFFGGKKYVVSKGGPDRLSSDGLMSSSRQIIIDNHNRKALPSLKHSSQGSSPPQASPEDHTHTPQALAALSPVRNPTFRMQMRAQGYSIPDVSALAVGIGSGSVAVQGAYVSPAGIRGLAGPSSQAPAMGRLGPTDTASALPFAHVVEPGTEVREVRLLDALSARVKMATGHSTY
jgi:hypothetical protein